ncbi:His-Xaa-Ser repeat protein HxsA [Salinicola lusitanus]|uniref:His-Xaa-Ser repeat protein HxsA n=1 Tax=Salinicola lusitanus TaxID=1949085 RepID=UPI000DA21229
MPRFIKSLSLFLAGAAGFNANASATEITSDTKFTPDLTPISLRPLNMPGDNMYAAHRSHSSHSSHASHRSGSGSYSAPSKRYSSPRPPLPSSGVRRGTTGSSQPVDPGRPATVTSRSGNDIDPSDVSLQDLVRRVQLALVVQGYEPGSVDGVMGPKTRSALRSFQKDNHLEVTGRMTNETLNSLNVVAR